MLTKTYTVPAQPRFTIWVDAEEMPAGSGQSRWPTASRRSSLDQRRAGDRRAGDVVARARDHRDFWYEAHNSPGATTTGTRWALGGG